MAKLICSLQKVSLCWKVKNTAFRLCWKVKNTAFRRKSQVWKSNFKRSKHKVAENASYLCCDVWPHFLSHTLNTLRVNTAVILVRCHTVIQWLIITDCAYTLRVSKHLICKHPQKRKKNLETGKYQNKKKTASTIYSTFFQLFVKKNQQDSSLQMMRDIIKKTKKKNHAR